MNKSVLVWNFHQAPKKYRELSEHGGDEDYVIVGYVKEDETYGVLSDIVDRLTVSDYQYIDIKEGDKTKRVYITTHA